MKSLKQHVDFIVGLTYLYFFLAFAGFAQPMDLTGPSTSNSVEHFPTLFTYAIVMIIG